MYFSNITNNELQQFHEKVKNNFTVKLSELITGNRLFRVEVMGELLKIFPLFYTDRIESSNGNDRVLDNKCIICEKKLGTTLFFIVDETVPVLSLDYTFYSDFVDYFVFNVFDGFNGNVLSSVNVKAIFKDNDKIVQELELVTDKKGIVYFNTSQFTFDDVEITFEVTNVTKTFKWSG